MRKEVAIRVLTLTTIGSLIFGYIEKKEADKQRIIAEKHIELLEKTHNTTAPTRKVSIKSEVIPEFEMITSRSSISRH